MKLYLTVARELERMIRSGSLRAGDKLPSVRLLKDSHGVSLSTVLHAYSTLELAGLMEARPRSGYYVAARPKPPVPGSSKPKRASTRVAVSDLVFDTLEASRDRGSGSLGSAFPGPAQFPWAKLARYLGSSARRMDPWSTVESLPPGSVELRRQIVRRYLRLGMSIDVGEVIITSGALEALNLALQTVVSSRGYHCDRITDVLRMLAGGGTPRVECRGDSDGSSARARCCSTDQCDIDAFHPCVLVHDHTAASDRRERPPGSETRVGACAGEPRHSADRGRRVRRIAVRTGARGAGEGIRRARAGLALRIVQ